ncbi:MAG: TetR/AcrR family transcriptional regulator [Phycisphaeraceae bacterium]|nr:TetR/AcrR family transcriptional regulator [Phycisphaeraceae bacterium]
MDVSIHSQAAPATVQLSREQILTATVSCLTEKGYDATTIRTISARLGCAVGSIYRYFEDKRELLSAATQRLLEGVAQSVDDGAAIEQSFRSYYQQAAGEEASYRLMFWLASVTPDHRRDAISMSPPAPGSTPAPGSDPAPGSGTNENAEINPAPATLLRASNKLPAVVVRIIDGWARQLGDVALARQVWASLHGSILVGDPIEQTMTFIGRLAGLDGSPADGATRNALPVEAPRRLEAVPAVAAAAAPSDSRQAVTEDVCLL